MVADHAECCVRQEDSGYGQITLGGSVRNESTGPQEIVIILLL